MSDYAVQIATKAYDILSDALRTEFVTFRRTPMLSVTKADLPILGIYILRERRVPDGQPNQGVPKFIHQLTLGFSGGVDVETDEENRLNELEQTMTLLDELLLSNPEFINLTEGVTLMDRTSQYAKVGEVSLAEIRVEMVVQFRSQWEPTITDNLETIHVDTQFPDKAHADAGTPQIVREYELDQNS